MGSTSCSLCADCQNLLVRNITLEVLMGTLEPPRNVQVCVHCSAAKVEQGQDAVPGGQLLLFHGWKEWI